MESSIALERPTPAAPSHFLAGAGNVFQKELREWFRTRKFLVTTALTSLMLAAVPVILFLHEGGLHDGRINSGYKSSMEAWMGLTLTLGAYLIVALTMGVIVKEEDAGTAQWLFTKPVSRTGYVLAKYAGNVVAVLLSAIIIPSVVFVALTAATQASGITAWTPVIEGVAFASLHAAIVVAVVMGLSAFFRTTAPIAGIAIGLGFLPLFLQRFVTAKVINLFPVNIGAIAGHAVRGEALTPWQPVICGIIIAVVALTVACYRIERRQLQ